MNRKFYLMAVLCLTSSCFCITGCENPPPQILTDEEGQAKLRSIRSRTFDTTDQVRTLRAAMATLQDLGFLIDDADHILGTISAIKRDHHPLRFTITVRPHSVTQMLVRADAHYNLKIIEEAEPYQQFFTALEKTMSLKAHQIK